MEVLAIIPARGGSKKVPGKNIRPLNGVPMLHYSIREARRSRHITRVIVSTDDEAIARVAREGGAEVPFLRPTELAGDRVTDLPVFQHAIRHLESTEGYRPEIIAHLRPTAPLRRAEHIDAGIDMLLNSDADSVRSVTAAGQHPHKMWRFEGTELRPFLPGLSLADEPFNQPRQLLPPAFIQNGSVDIVRREVILDRNSMTGRKILGLLMDELDSINVDHEEDFLLAELLMRRRETAAARAVAPAADPNAQVGPEARTLCVDIDGVLAVPRADLKYAECEPIPGAADALRRLRDRGFFVALFTGRHFNRLGETRGWLERHGIPYDHLVMGKPTARYYIDDRGITFRGDWTEVEREIGGPSGGSIKKPVIDPG